MDDTFWRILIVGLAIAVTVETVVIIGLMREVGELAIRITGDPSAQEDGGPPAMSEVSIPGVEAGTPSLAIFMSPGCPYCEDLAPALPQLVTEYAGLVNVVPIITASDELERVRYSEDLPIPARVDLPDLAGEWNVPGTPFVVAIDHRGRVRAAYVPRGGDALDLLAQRLVEAEAEPEGGDPDRLVAAGSRPSSGG